MVSKLHHSGITIKILKSLKGGGCTVGLMQARAGLQNPCWVTSWHSPPLCDLFWGLSLFGHTTQHTCPFPQETLHLGPGQHNLTCSRCCQTWDSFPFPSTSKDSHQVWLCLWCLTQWVLCLSSAQHPVGCWWGRGAVCVSTSQWVLRDHLLWLAACKRLTSDTTAKVIWLFIFVPKVSEWDPASFAQETKHQQYPGLIDSKY